MTKLTAYIYLDAGKTYWEFRDNKDEIESCPDLIKAAKIKWYPGTKSDKNPYYWVERPSKKEERSKLEEIFKSFGFSLNDVEPKVEDIPVADEDVIKKARVLLKHYRQTEEANAAIYTAYQEAKNELQSFVKENGIKTKPETDDAILVVDDSKLQHQYVEGRANWNEQFMIKWMKENGFANKVIQVEAIDWEHISKEEYNSLPSSVRTTYENRSEPTYKFQIYNLNKYNCPHCNTYVGKNAKFCPECGEKLLKKEKVA